MERHRAQGPSRLTVEVALGAPASTCLSVQSSDDSFGKPCPNVPSLAPDVPASSVLHATSSIWNSIAVAELNETTGPAPPGGGSQTAVRAKASRAEPKPDLASTRMAPNMQCHYM
jgi:hypothetical protein